MLGKRFLHGQDTVNRAMSSRPWARCLFRCQFSQELCCWLCLLSDLDILPAKMPAPSMRMCTLAQNGTSLSLGTFSNDSVLGQRNRKTAATAAARAVHFDSLYPTWIPLIRYTSTTSCCAVVICMPACFGLPHLLAASSRAKVGLPATQTLQEQRCHFSLPNSLRKPNVSKRVSGKIASILLGGSCCIFPYWGSGLLTQIGSGGRDWTLWFDWLQDVVMHSICLNSSL